jgi:hypothetical protein
MPEPTARATFRIFHLTALSVSSSHEEVQKLLTALQSSGRSFTLPYYTNAPGGHQFNRLDREFARESRPKGWLFLAEYLTPQN